MVNKGVSFMNKAMKIVVVVALIVVVGIVVAMKQQGKNAVSESTAAASSNTEKLAQKSPDNSSAAQAAANLPRLVDLGATKCVPCKMMKPILDELKSTYVGKLDVVFIDVWENEQAGRQYGIESIPTQIFFNETGKELYRHVGFMPKEDILAKWKELGFNLEKAK
jgi:thioredoxin 1